MKLADLIKKMEECHTLMLDYHGKSVTETDPAKAQEYVTLLNGKQAEFDTLQAQVTSLKKVEESTNLLNQAKALNAPDLSGMNFNPPPPVGASQNGDGKTILGSDGKVIKEFEYKAKADIAYQQSMGTVELVNCPVRNQQLLGKIFADWFAFGPSVLDGEAFSAIQSKDSRITREYEGACVIPQFMREYIRGKSVRHGNETSIIDPISGKVVLSTDATGGSTDSGANNLLAPDFRPYLLQYAVLQPDIYSMCSFFRSINGKVMWPMLDQTQGNYGGVAFSWKSTEGADKGETEPVFTDFELLTHELSGWTEMSLQALRRSSIDLQATLMNLFRNAAQAEFSNMVLNGSGVNRPLGVAHASATGVVEVARETANAVSWVDLTNLEFAIPFMQRRNGRYVNDDTVEKYLKQTLDTLNRPIFTNDVNSNFKDRLGGYPYTPHKYGSLSLGTRGDVIFGDWSSYAFAMEEEIAIARSEHAEFKKGRIVYRMICYVGGKPIYPQHFAVLDDPTA